MSKLIVGLIIMPCMLWGGLATVKVILGKQPGNSAIQTADTDAAGNVKFRVNASGVYQLRIFCPQPCPPKPGQYTMSSVALPTEALKTGERSASPDHRQRPRKLFIVPDIAPEKFPAEGLTVYTEEIVVFRAPAIVYATLRPAEPLLSTNALTFIAEEGGPPPQPQSLIVIAAGAPAFSYNIQTFYKKWRDDTGTPPTWLTLSQTRGSYPPPDRLPEIQVTAATRGLTAGLYQAELRHSITMDDGTVIHASAVATLLVKPAGTGPGLTVSRSGLLYTSLVGANPEVEMTRLCNQSAAAINWTSTIPPGQSQLISLAPAQGTVASGACTDVRVTATTRTLAAGVTRGPPILINRPGPSRPLSLDTSIFVATPNCVANTVYPVVLSSPPQLLPRAGNNFEVVPVDNCGGIAAQGVVSVDRAYARRMATLVRSDSAPGAAQKAIKAGGQAGFLTFAPDSAEDERDVDIPFTGEAPPLKAATVIIIVKSISNIKNNLSVPIEGPVGSLSNPKGPGLPSPGDPSFMLRGWSQLINVKVALSDTIEGEGLIINGKKPAILFSSPLEIAIIIPSDTPPGRHTVLLETPDGLSMVHEFDVEVAQPALYTWDGTGQGPAMVYNATRRGMVTASNPALADDVLVAYVDGLGAVDPAIPDGQAAPQDPLSRAINPVEVTIAGKTAEVLFAGPVPGYTGFSQINFKAPSGLTGTAAVEQEEIVVKVADVVNAQSATSWFAKTRTQTARVIVTTNPAGLAVFVDGARIVTPRTYNWPVDSVHTLSVASPQNETATARLIFSNWDGDTYTQSYNVTANANYTVTANFIQQYKLTTAVTLPANFPALVARPTIATTPASTDGFYNAGTAVRLIPGANASLRFNNWTGDATGAVNPLIVTLTGVKSVTAVYVTATIGPAPGPSPVSGLAVSTIRLVGKEKK